MAKRAEEAVEQEVQQLDESIGTVSEAVKTVLHRNAPTRGANY